MMDLSFWLLGGSHSIVSDLFQSLLWWICLFDHFIESILILAIVVSILVMMDLSFWHSIMKYPNKRQSICFNPCYDGFVFLTSWSLNPYISCICFNPCYDGFVFLTGQQPSQWPDKISFNPCYDGFVFLTVMVCA